MSALRRRDPQQCPSSGMSGESRCFSAAFAAKRGTIMQRGKPFRKGASGNPAGKRKGTRHRTTRAVEALLEGEAEDLTRKAIEFAKAGDMAALRLCLERIAPPRKDRPIAFRLRPIKTAAEAAAAMAGHCSRCCDGRPNPDRGRRRLEGSGDLYWDTRDDRFRTAHRRAGGARERKSQRRQKMRTIERQALGG